MENLHSDIESVRILVQLLVQKEIKHVVLSPGSRNAPLIVSVAREKRLIHHVIVDERSAAFFALGMAQQSGEPVAIICTSGTALLNYSPAIAEAYYQGVPLIVISADRPAEWIDQDDSQTIRQQNALQNFVKASYQLPGRITCNEEHWHTNRMINEAINLAREARKGPVHVNIPLREPLYEFHEIPVHEERVIENIPINNNIDPKTLSRLQKHFCDCSKIMIVVGFNTPDSELQNYIRELSVMPNVTVLVESVANLRLRHSHMAIDRTLSAIEKKEYKTYAPDLLITFGGALISRMLKEFLREHSPKEHWHMDERIVPPDTYKTLTHHFRMSPTQFFKQLLIHQPSKDCARSDYARRWTRKAIEANINHELYLKQIPWCDLKAFAVLILSLPLGSRLQLGNSTPIRYAQLFPYIQVERTDANRGTSGIDGCTSTAVGASFMFEGITTLIVGDNSFLYDSNALWIKNIPPRLKIIVLQNGGGGIFRFLPGPSGLDEVEDYFETPHEVNIRQLAEVHRFNVFSATDEASLKQILPDFYRLDERPSVLIIETPRLVNGQILKEYFKSLSLPISQESIKNLEFEFTYPRQPDKN